MSVGSARVAMENRCSCATVQTKILVLDLVAAGNACCEGPEWAAFNSIVYDLDIGAAPLVQL